MNTTATPITAIANEAPNLRMHLTLDQCIQYRKLKSVASTKNISSNSLSVEVRVKEPITGAKRCREESTASVLESSAQTGTCHQPKRKKTKVSPQHKEQAQKRQQWSSPAQEWQQTRLVGNNAASRYNDGIGQHRKRPHRKTSILAHRNNHERFPRTDRTYSRS
jgi:hypothetical protein